MTFTIGWLQDAWHSPLHYGSTPCSRVSPLLMQSTDNLQNAFDIGFRSILELAVRNLGHCLRSTGSTQNLVLQSGIER